MGDSDYEEDAASPAPLSSHVSDAEETETLTVAQLHRRHQDNEQPLAEVPESNLELLYTYNRAHYRVAPAAIKLMAEAALPVADGDVANAMMRDPKHEGWNAIKLPNVGFFGLREEEEDGWENVFPFCMMVPSSGGAVDSDDNMESTDDDRSVLVVPQCVVRRLQSELAEYKTALREKGATEDRKAVQKKYRTRKEYDSRVGKSAQKLDPRRARVTHLFHKLEGLKVTSFRPREVPKSRKRTADEADCEATDETASMQSAPVESRLLTSADGIVTLEPVFLGPSHLVSIHTSADGGKWAVRWKQGMKDA